MNARRQEREGEYGRIVTVFSPKGGSGKSVVSTNLAAAAAAHGKQRTLLVDLDLQFGDAAIMLGLQPRSTVRELLGTPSEPARREAQGLHRGAFLGPAGCCPRR